MFETGKDFGLANSFQLQFMSTNINLCAIKRREKEIKFKGNLSSETLEFDKNRERK